MKLFLLAGVLGVASAHMCLVSPPQRGGLTETDLNTAFSKPCGLKTFPCGGAAESSTRADMTVGSPFDVIIQKNGDHYQQQNVGYFNVTLFIKHKAPQTLATIADTNAPSLHLYTTNVLASNMDVGEGYIQITYKSGLLGQEYYYYACSDVVVKTSSGPAVG